MKRKNKRKYVVNKLGFILTWSIIGWVNEKTATGPQETLKKGIRSLKYAKAIVRRWKALKGWENARFTIHENWNKPENMVEPEPIDKRSRVYGKNPNE